MKHQQKGLTLLESVIALGLVIILISAIAINYKSEKWKAEQIIAQLQMAKSGVLQYNIDNPESTRLLADLVRPSEAAQEKWKGPYGDTTTRITPDGQFDISKIFPDSSLELVAETINGVIYQAVLLKGTAELQLKSTILAKCGSDCQPLPGRDDIGLLVQQIGIIAQNTTGFDTNTVPSVDAPVAPPSPSWTGPPTTVSPTVSIPPITPAVPTPLVVPPSTPSTPVPTPKVPTTNPAPPTPSEPLPFSVPPPITTTETQTLACPVGYSGTRVQSRTRTYTPSTGQTVYSAWADSTNTCTPPPPPYIPPQQCESVFVGTECENKVIRWVESPYSIWLCHVYGGPSFRCEPIYEVQCHGKYETVCK